MNAEQRKTRSGMSLVELMSALAVFTVISGAAYMFFSRAETAAGVRDSAAQAQQKARDHVDRIVLELGQSGLTCPDWSFAADAVTFNKAIAFDGDSIVWSPAITYSLTPALGEALDGTDDNGNGLVDECYLQRTEDQTDPGWGYELGLPSQTFAGFIQAGDLIFAIVEDMVTIDLTVSNFYSNVGGVISGRQITAVALRN